MSDLRNKLDAAKREHSSLRYPGDLAAELLTPARSNRVDMVIRISAVLAMAAAVLIVVRIRMIAPEKTSEPVLDQYAQIEPESTSDTEEADDSENQVASIGELPAMSLPDGVSENVDLAPAPPDFSFSAPSFSLIGSETDSQNTSTTREPA